MVARFVRVPVSLVSLLAAAACGPSKPPAPIQGPLDSTVFAATWPLHTMASRLVGGDGAPRVWCALAKGEDPKLWRPTRKSIETIQNAKLILVNGADYEPWLMSVSLPMSRVIDASLGLKGKLLTVPTVTHSHGGDASHTHEGFDGLVWLDPRQARVQCEAVAAGLRRAFPELAARIAHNLRAMNGEFADLDRRVESLAGLLEGAKLFCAHRSYGYLVRRFGCEITNLELDPRTPPSEARRQEVERKLAGTKRNILLWPDASTKEVAESWQKIGLVSVPFAIAAAPGPSRKGFTAVLQASLDRLAAALK